MKFSGVGSARRKKVLSESEESDLEQDMLAEVYLFEDGVETKIPFKEREVLLNRLKMAKRDGTGTKMRS